MRAQELETLLAAARPLIELAIAEDIGPGDAIITNDPEIAIPFAELYKGRAPVLGLNNGGFPLPNHISRRLAETTAQHRQVWWLPPRPAR